MNTETSLVEAPQTQAVVFGTTNVDGILAKATEIATKLTVIIEKKKLYKTIGPRKHVYVEGWTAMGAMLGVFPECEYSKRLEREGEVVYLARTVLRTLGGHVIGSGEAICSDIEKNWSGRDEYAIKSMAQTRSVGKAFRLSFSWIVSMAGFDVVPAEEADSIEAESEKKMEAAAEGQVSFVPESFHEKADSKGRWTKYGIKNGENGWFTTFDSTLGGAMKRAKDLKKKVTLTYSDDGKFKNIQSLKVED